MMKKNFEKSFSVSVGLLLAASMIIPAVGLAAVRAQKGNDTSISAPKATGVCLRTGELSSKIDQRLVDNENKIKERRTERTANLKERRDKRDENLADFREKWNENREQFYAKLEEKADTSVKKQALEKFKAAVESAVKSRRAAIDKAIDNYRDGLDKLIADRKKSIDAAKSTYRNTIRSEFQNANGSCAKNDVDSAEVRTELHARLKAARDKYQSDIQTAEKIGDSIQILIKARREAVAKAIEDFKTALEKARTDLKTAWGETSSTETGE